MRSVLPNSFCDPHRGSCNNFARTRQHPLPVCILLPLSSFFFLRWGTAQSTARLYHYLDSLVHSIPLCSLTPPRGNHPGEKQTIVLEAWSEMPPRDGPSLPLLLSPHKSEKWTTTPPPSLGLLAVAACVSVTRKKSILPSPSRETQSPTVLAVDEPCTLSNC